MLGFGIGRAEGGVERLGLALFHEALAVGRIRDDDAAVGRAVKFPRVRHREGDAVVHAGAAGIVARHGDGAGVNVGGEDVVVAACARFFARLRPDLGRQPCPLHGRKVAADARRAALGGQRRLDGNGAAAAKRVAEITPAAVARDVHERGGQRLAQGRGHVRRAVAALVQRRAGRVEIERGRVMHERELDLVQGAGLGKPVDAVALLERLDDGFFDDLLAVGHRVQGRLQTVALDGEGRVRRQIVRPRQGLHALEERVKRWGWEVAQLEQHALAEAAADVHARDVRVRTRAAHAAVFGHDAAQAHVAQLIAERALEPEQARHAQFVVRHRACPRFLRVFRAARPQPPARPPVRCLPPVRSRASLPSRASCPQARR